ncbi:hypothetical protein, partial [Pseudomonas syringae]|uniref:hypothetical protein n=1 Tax=Pseudomonas syringae TaxID=317 RepID=UPI001F41CF31
HFHADHPVFSCSKSEQKQLNTWVSFQSAEEPLLGQFSVSGNTPAYPSRLADPTHTEIGPCLERQENSTEGLGSVQPTAGT